MTAAAYKHVAVASRCLAIVMEKSSPSDLGNNDIRRVNNNNKIGKRTPDDQKDNSSDNGYRIYQEFQDENRTCYWNPALVESINAVDYVGFVRPGTLFVSGAEIHLECLRCAWARRVLKSPPGFTIKSLGDVGGIEMQEVPQTQFIPLPEVLCLIVSSLNRLGQPALLANIIEHLQKDYSSVVIPNEEILYATLASLMAEGKLFCMGEHYFVPTPAMMMQHYQQAMFLRRPPLFWNNDDPFALMQRQFVAKQQQQQQQEMCSRECQTGASIANGVPPYKPPPAGAVGKKDQAASAKLQRDGNNNTENKSRSNNARRKSSMKEQKPEHLKSEKVGFFTRLFRGGGRTASKSRGDEKQQITKPQHDSQQPSSSSTTCEQGNGNGITQPQLAPPPLTTFSAQFPPPEWLYDPRFFKALGKTTGQCQQYQHLFSKIRKSSKEPTNQVNRDWNNVWLDTVLKQQQQQQQHQRQGDRFHVGQRHPTCPENLARGTVYGQWSPKQERRRQRHRLSKYLSSSSECLNYPSCAAGDLQAEPTTNHPFREPSAPVKKHHRQRHAAAKQATMFASAEIQNLEKFPVTEPCHCSGTERDGGGKKSVPTTPINGGTTATAVQTAVSTVIHREPTTARTSTPVPSPLVIDKSRKCTPYRDTVRGGGGQKVIGTTDNNNNNGDSAISSTSPVITEMSTSDAKYSSWSGSDGRNGPADEVENVLIQDRTYVNVPKTNVVDKENVADKNRNPLDHTYINDNVANVDHTYENLSKDHSFESTQFENLSNDNNDDDSLTVPPTNDKPTNVVNFESNNCAPKIRPSYMSSV